MLMCGIQKRLLFFVIGFLVWELRLPNQIFFNFLKISFQLMIFIPALITFWSLLYDKLLIGQNYLAILYILHL